MPNVSPPFKLSSLPKISSLSDPKIQTSHLKVASESFYQGTDRVTVGISGSGISQYIINPTPKLLFNIPIPSTNNITACNVGYLKDGDKNIEMWAYGLTVAKSNTLNVSRKISNASDNKADSASSLDGEISQSISLKVDDIIVDIKVFPKQKQIISVLKNGSIQFYDFELKLLHSFNINYSEIQFVQYFTENKQDFLLLLSDVNEGESSTCFKLYQLYSQNDESKENVANSNQIKELSSTIVQGFVLSESKVFYQFGKLYRLDQEHQLHIYSLPKFQLLQTISLSDIFTNGSNDIITVKPVAQNRIVLCVNDVIYLLDTLYKSILDKRELSHVKTFQLLESAPIYSNSTDNRTLLIGVSTEGSSNSASLEIINIEVGSGSLKDSLGKGFTKQTKKTNKKQNQLKPLFSEDDKDCPVKSKEGIMEFNYDSILKELKSANNVKKFDDVFFNKLNIKNDHYTENDRFISDQLTFFSDVLDLIFKNYKSGYPRALTFLLTHPLFPIKRTTGLLSELKEDPRLFKQAVVTCPNLPLNELLFELFTINNSELTLDISLRVLQDYSKEDIKQEIKVLNKVDIENFINFVINPSSEEVQMHGTELFELLSLVLDSMGLFALEGELLERVSQFVDEQVTIAERNTELWYLLEDKKNGHTNSHASNLEAAFADTEALKPYSVEYLEI